MKYNRLSKLDYLPTRVQGELANLRLKGATLMQLQGYLKKEGYYVSLPAISKWLKRKRKVLRRIVFSSNEVITEIGKQFLEAVKGHREYHDSLMKEWKELDKLDNIKERVRLKASLGRVINQNYGMMLNTLAGFTTKEMVETSSEDLLSEARRVLRLD